MRVSVTLHRQQPDEDGNQRDFEANYRDYNRNYADLAIDPKTGNATCVFEGMKFPPIPADPQVLTHFSLGVSQAPADQGGAIIIAGPLSQVILGDVGVVPVLSVAAGVPKARLDQMLADGRLFSLD